MKSKHLKVLHQVFSSPTSSCIRFADIETLFKAVGATVVEREGSRLRVELNGEVWHCHRPHPGKDAKRYQVEQARELLERTGYKP